MIKDAKVLKEDVLFNKYGKKFIVEKLQMPDGFIGEWAYMSSRGGTLIVTLDKQMNIILVGQYRYNLKCYTYENCCGGIEGAESVEQSATRELLEETGYKPTKIVPLGKYYDLPSETNHWCYVLIALDCQREAVPVFDDNVEKYFDMSIKKINFLEIYNSLGSEESIIKSSEHISAIFLAHKYLTANKLI